MFSQVLWEEAVSTKLDDHMGEVFEMACRDFVRRASQASAECGPLPFRPLRVGEWWDASSNAEVDVVALGGRGELLVGQCKWRAVTGRHLTELRERATQLTQELGDATDIHLALFSGRGKADDQVRKEVEAGRVLLFTAETMVGRA